MNNFLESVKIIEIIGGLFFVSFVYSNFIGLIKTKRIAQNFNSELIPEILVNFPDHNTSKKAYIRAKNKIDKFVDSVLNEQATTIQISEKEINDLHTKGVTANKNNPGKFLYYQIKNNSVIEYLLEYPTKLSHKAYRSRIRERIYYKNNLSEYTRIIEENERNMNEKLQVLSLNKSTLILFIFQCLKSPDSYFYKFEETVKYKNAVSIIKKINSIEISDDCIIIKSFGI